uniref:Chromo domain-containing protein n=1 Tax=Chromera velia CCMP2878 TaxID=1169474 RepID=A0A0G4HBN5_9ALVE|eukprot:Cvel_25893.t1-p1 / transcript=Cvel_25893.t1 / gene=Cvel_25893 / organism=Chromera_velia_CCMP2878 / gene_product=Retrotransposable element Tf2 155 kDa protein type, putative / transcript_product=Retrotransposable element Tf2 155 kDa protein type, putative / location=Cvel_scaffold2991:3887-5236(+) / protein_length=279 / sequence_SO=supercontig / SO=protein_coding / is_pseudo=false
MRNGLFYYKNRLAIPTKKLQRNLIFECHDIPGTGHLVIEKTYLRLIEDFYWPNMFSSVAAYVPRCDACLQNKQANQKPFRLLQPLPIPARPYDSVSMDFVCTLPRVHFQELKERLERANEEAKRKADQKRREATFIPGDWVLVYQKFFESERLPSERKAKLSHIWYGPFEIDKKVGEVSYELMFPAGVRKYPVVHVSYMKAYPISPEDPLPRVLLPRFEEAEWEVDKVIDMRGKGRTLQYHVVWSKKGYSETEATLKPPENLKNAKDAIKPFRELRRLR